jgi:type II secretory pathway component PulF
MSMHDYKYSAFDSDGQVRSGVIRGTGEQDAARRLKADGLTPTRLERIVQRGPVFSYQRTKLKDIAALTRELSVLVEARIPLGRGLLSIAEHEPKPEMRAMVLEIATAIESGSPVTQAFEKYRHIFGDIYIETIRGAEKSGNLAEVTLHLADMLEKQMETSQQVRRALTYPVIVLAVVAIAVSVIVVFVVPRFAQTFSAHDVRMPMVTRAIQGLGMSVRHHWYAYAGVTLGAIFGTAIAWRTTVGRHAIERLAYRAPYIGKILQAVTAGRFARVFSIGLGSGLGVIESLEMSGRSTGRPLFVIECDEMADRLRQGDQLGDVIRRSHQLPSFARRLIGAGKDSEEVSKACGIIARHYDAEANHLTKNINTIIEPLLTLALAAIVLIVALSVFLPMWQMVKLNH